MQGKTRIVSYPPSNIPYSRNGIIKNGPKYFLKLKVRIRKPYVGQTYRAKEIAPAIKAVGAP